jgi:hypothetical protein
MLDDIRKTVESGFDAISKQAPDQVTPLIAAVQTAAEQLMVVAAGILEWSATASDGVSRGVMDRVPQPVKDLKDRVPQPVKDLKDRVPQPKDLKGLVPQQIRDLGLASKRDLEALAARVARLERTEAKPEHAGAKGSKAKKSDPANEGGATAHPGARPD